MQVKTNVDQLVSKLETLQGMNVLTVISADATIHLFELHDGELIAHTPIPNENTLEHLIFLLKDAIANGGAVVIRQNTPLKVEMSIDERKTFVPIQNIYGIHLGNNQWRGISAQDMEIIHCTDAQTGERLPKEENVVYCSFV